MTDQSNAAEKKKWGVGRLIGGFFLIAVTLSAMAGASFAMFSYLKIINEIKSNYVYIEPGKIDKANEGKAVYIYGEVKTDEILVDPLYNVKVNALTLWRVVENYVVDEERLEKEDESMAYGRQISGEEPPGIYTRVDHGKSGTNPFLPWRNYAENVNLGEFSVDDYLVGSLGGSRKYKFSDSHFEKLNFTTPESLPFVTIPAAGNNEYLYMRKDEKISRIGDYRISFGYTEPGYFSLIARQEGGRLVPLRQGEEFYKNMRFAAPGKVPAHSLVRSDMIIFVSIPAAGIFFSFLCGIAGFSILQPVFGTALGYPVKKGDFIGGDVGLFALYGALLLTVISVVAGWFISL